ncbi:CD48 antigen-like isoform X2 [Paramisgurnus dabryanus]|uniref:CD48 antigen-like isoform X2 n=1 Tax=Paramisgurnus dabryanus TaxID=90735 RepID=UPI0031F40061
MVSWQLLTYLLLAYSTGFSTEDTVFVKTGDFVELNIQRDKLPDEFDDIVWQNEKSQTIVKYSNEYKRVKDYDDYKDRVDFNTKSFSLTLKNMKKTDSGVYTARITGNRNKDVAEHRVSVIDAVEAPVLTVNSDSSSGLCNFTCKTDSITINTVINNSSSCSEEVTSSGVYNLSVRCINDFIICNHSNPVSWKNDKKTIEPICIVSPEKRTSTEKSSRLYWLIRNICISLGLFGTVVGLLCFYKNKKGT